MVLVLELSDDEAELVAAAVSETAVRFFDMPLTEALAFSRGYKETPADGDEITLIRSEGAVYLDRGPLDVDAMLRRE